MRKSLSCVRKKKLKCCNLDHLGIAILANSFNLVNLGNLILTILATFANLPD